MVLEKKNEKKKACSSKTSQFMASTFMAVRGSEAFNISLPMHLYKNHTNYE